MATLAARGGVGLRSGEPETASVGVQWCSQLLSVGGEAGGTRPSLWWEGQDSWSEVCGGPVVSETTQSAWSVSLTANLSQPRSLPGAALEQPRPSTPSVSPLPTQRSGSVPRSPLRLEGTRGGISLVCFSWKLASVLVFPAARAVSA